VNGNNIALLTRVVKRLQKDGIPFEMEDVDMARYPKELCASDDTVQHADSRGIPVGPRQPVEFVSSPGTIITYGPNVEFNDEEL
jgi:hypothetical protein